MSTFEMVGPATARKRITNQPSHKHMLEPGGMKIANRPPMLAFLFPLGFVLTCFGSSVADKAQATNPAAAQQKEYDMIQKRFHAHEDLLDAAGWTLCHCADEKQVKAVEKTLDLISAFTETNGFKQLLEAGGLQTFKANVPALLENKDPVVRGFGAMLLAVIGDAAYKTNIAKLLADKHGSPFKEQDRLLWNFDRSRAAMALGLMGAREYASRLCELLRSPDAADRAGAALGLGYMGAKDYASIIAKLLADDEDQVQAAAIYALAELDAAEYAKGIARLLTSLGDPGVQQAASYALARLNAKEQASELAKLLDEEFHKGDAAKALALLGARQYTEKIAGLLEDSDPLVRCDALVALGILDAKEHVKNVAAHLQDKEPFVRAYAAVALLLMGDRTNSAQVLDVMRKEWKLSEIASDGLDINAYFRTRLRLPSLVAEKQRQLTMRATRGWEQLQHPEKGLQPDGATNGSQPIRSDTNSTSSAGGSRR